MTAGIISTCSLCRTQWFLLYFASDTCCIERVSQSELVHFAANSLKSTILGWLLAVCVRDKVEIDAVFLYGGSVDLFCCVAEILSQKKL